MSEDELVKKVNSALDKLRESQEMASLLAKISLAKDKRIAYLEAKNKLLRRDFVHLARGKVDFEYADGYYTAEDEEVYPSYAHIVDELGPGQISEVHSYVSVKGPTKFCFIDENIDDNEGRCLFDTLGDAESALSKGGQGNG